MKIDRVILALTNNKLYEGFWEYVSEIWAVNFNITPTLFFYGEKDEFDIIPCSFGEKYHLPFVKEVCVNPNRDWACTWGLFYGASMFPDETCITCGIDQVPFSNLILNELLKYYSEDKYLIGFADAYPEENDWYVSSHHLAKGSLYKSLLNIEDSWEKEVKKVFTFRNKYKLYPGSDYWGLDEKHSSFLLNRNPEKLVLCKNIFHDLLLPNRIDRSDLRQIDISKLRRGCYSEIHAPRPFSKYLDFFDKIKPNIPTQIS